MGNVITDISADTTDYSNQNTSDSTQEALYSTENSNDESTNVTNVTTDSTTSISKIEITTIPQDENEEFLSGITKKNLVIIFSLALGVSNVVWAMVTALCCLKLKSKKTFGEFELGEMPS